MDCRGVYEPDRPGVSRFATRPARSLFKLVLGAPPFRFEVRKRQVEYLPVWPPVSIWSEFDYAIRYLSLCLLSQ